MQSSIKSIIACGCLAAVIAATAACGPRPIPPLSVTDLMEDRVTLDGVLMKCNRDQSKARTNADCVNARIAIERLASQNEPAEAAKRAENFERSREQLRLAQEKQRRELGSESPKSGRLPPAAGAGRAHTSAAALPGDVAQPHQHESAGSQLVEANTATSEPSPPWY